MSDSHLNLSSAFDKHPARWTAAALAVVLLGVLGGLWWLANEGDGITFLSERAQGKWIVFPGPPDGIIHPNSVFEGRFRRTWVAPSAPASATLSIRALKFCSVTLNGAVLPMPDNAGTGWRDTISWDLKGQLRPGTNEMTVSVFNTNGLPALWLVMSADGSVLVSDTNWDVSLVGCSWRKAALAS